MSPEMALRLARLFGNKAAHKAAEGCMTILIVGGQILKGALPPETRRG